MHLSCPLSATASKNFLNYFSNKAKPNPNPKTNSVCMCVVKKKRVKTRLGARPGGIGLESWSHRKAEAEVERTR